VTLALLMDSGAEPVFVSETLWVDAIPTLTLPKLNEVALKERTGVPTGWVWAVEPLPLKGTLTVGSVALLEIVSVAETDNAEAGVKVALNVWLVPGLRLSGNLIPEILKSEFETAMEETVSEASPVLVICRLCEELDPIATLPKLSCEALTVKMGSPRRSRACPDSATPNMSAAKATTSQFILSCAPILNEHANLWFVELFP